MWLELVFETWWSSWQSLCEDLVVPGLPVAHSKTYLAADPKTGLDRRLDSKPNPSRANLLKWQSGIHPVEMTKMVQAAKQQLTVFLLWHQHQHDHEVF